MGYWQGRVNDRGITVIELLIGAIIALIVGAAVLQFYQVNHELYLAQVDIVDRQGNLRYAIDALSRQVRRAGYRVPGNALLRVSSTRDTLDIYMGQDTSSAVDTLRYYVDHSSDPPLLMRQINKATPEPLAEGIDSAWFVPAGGSPPTQLAMSLVTVEQQQYENSALKTRRRLAETIMIRNQ
jgi:hypothetical protein